MGLCAELQLAQFECLCDSELQLCKQRGGAAEQRLQLSVRCVGMLLTSATEATTAERSLCNYVTRSSTASV